MYSATPFPSNENPTPNLPDESISAKELASVSEKEGDIYLNTFNDANIRRTITNKNNSKFEELRANDTRYESQGTLKIFSRKDEADGPPTIDVQEKESVFSTVKLEDKV